MKGSKEYKRYVTKHRKELHAMHWDDIYLFKLELDCKNIRYKPRAIQTKEVMKLQSVDF